MEQFLSTVTLPTDSQVTRTTASNQHAYIYAGFEGGKGANSKTYSTDMGVTLSSTAGPNQNIWGWKPALTLKDQNGNLIATPLVSGYAEVQYKNAYKMGSPVSMYWYYNTGSGTVKMKIIGTAYYATREAVGSETQLTTIMESNSTPAITSISKWKLLTTVTAANCKNYAVFSKVSLNGSPGTAIGSSYFPAAECTSGSSITRSTSGGYQVLTMNVNS